MKTIFYSITLTLLAGLLWSCDKSEDTTTGISNDEVADEVAATISSDFMSIAEDVSIVADDAENGRSASIQSCGISYDTAFVKTYTGDYVAYAFDVEYGYILTCTKLGVPSSLSWTLNTEGTWDGVRLSSEGATTGTLAITNIELSADNYVVNGALNRNQELTQKLRDKKTFNTQSEVTIKDLTIDKNTYHLTSGSATFSAVGVSSAGGSYQYSCEVVFLGNQTATITLKDGTSYTMNLSTGAIE